MTTGEADVIEQRRPIVAETCRAACAQTFARLNHQKPVAESREVGGAGQTLCHALLRPIALLSPDTGLQAMRRSC